MDDRNRRAFVDCMGPNGYLMDEMFHTLDNIGQISDVVDERSNNGDIL